jgi:hypothetical protein
MTVNEAAAYGMYPRNIALPDIVSSLNLGGFENKDICMVLSPAHPAATLVRDARIFNANLEDGAVSARMIGWFSEFGAVVIPTVGFFIRSQAFFHALVIEQNFSSACGQARTLVGLGFSGDEANRLGREMADVGVMVYVACEERARVDRAIELLRRTGAREAASLNSATAAAAVA